MRYEEKKNVCFWIRLVKTKFSHCTIIIDGMMTRTDTQKNTDHNRVGNNVMVSKVYKMDVLIGLYA